MSHPAGEKASTRRLRRLRQAVSSHPDLVAVASFALVLVVALVVWVFIRPSWDVVVTWAGLLVGFETFFVSRWIANKQHRRSSLRQLTRETRRNIGVISSVKTICKASEGKYQVFPRCYVAALEPAVASGLFDTDRDAELFNLLHETLNTCTVFNRRLDLTETNLSFGFNRTQIPNWYSKLREGEVLLEAERSLASLDELLTTRYSAESGFGKDDVM